MLYSGSARDSQNVGHPPLAAKTTAHDSQLTVVVVVEVWVLVVSVVVVVVVSVVEDEVVEVVVTPLVVTHLAS